jgi:hypothetical protein
VGDVEKRHVVADGTTRTFLDAQTGRPSAAHVGYVVSGRLTVRGADGVEVSVGPGEAFEAAPGHDAWGDGNEVCIAMDFLTAP